MTRMAPSLTVTGVTGGRTESPSRGRGPVPAHEPGPVGRARHRGGLFGLSGGSNSCSPRGGGVTRERLYIRRPTCARALCANSPSLSLSLSVALLAGRTVPASRRVRGARVRA